MTVISSLPTQTTSGNCVNQVQIPWAKNCLDKQTLRLAGRTQHGVNLAITCYLYVGHHIDANAFHEFLEDLTDFSGLIAHSGLENYHFGGRSSAFRFSLIIKADI